LLFSKIAQLLHWKVTPKPDIDPSKELYLQLRAFRLPLILTILTMMIGTLGYVVIDDFPLMDAIYQTGITFTTVGFGEISPISDAGRFFTITLVIAGFAIFSIAIGILVSEINNGELLRLLKERHMLYQVARLKNHFVICYQNEHTIEVTKQLQENHIPFVVVDENEELGRIARKNHYSYFIEEEPHREIAMLKAHLSSAKGVIALSKNMADNIALIASVRLFEKEHNLQKPLFIIANGKSDSDVEKLKKLGADSVVSSTKLSAQRITAMAARPDMENLLEQFLYKSDTPLDMEEIVVPKSSWLVLKKLKEAHLRDIADISIIGIRTKDGRFNPMPKGDVLITSGSKLLTIGTSKGLKIMKSLVEIKHKPKELKYV